MNWGLRCNSMEDASDAISSELSLNKRNALNMNGIVFLKGDSCGFIGSLRWIFLLYFGCYMVHSRVVKNSLRILQGQAK